MEGSPHRLRWENTICLAGPPSLCLSCQSGPEVWPKTHSFCLPFIDALQTVVCGPSSVAPLWCSFSCCRSQLSVVLVSYAPSSDGSLGSTVVFGASFPRTRSTPWVEQCSFVTFQASLVHIKLKTFYVPSQAICFSNLRNWGVDSNKSWHISANNFAILFLKCKNIN